MPMSGLFLSHQRAEKTHHLLRNGFFLLYLRLGRSALSSSRKIRRRVASKTSFLSLSKMACTKKVLF